MREEVRKAALAPENVPSKLVGQLIGNILSKISWQPDGFVFLFFFLKKTLYCYYILNFAIIYIVNKFNIYIVFMKKNVHILKVYIIYIFIK
jgi:hypothetical protein